MINDGHNYPFRIAASEGLYQEIIGTRRPCSVTRMAEFRDQIVNCTQVVTEKKTAQLIADHLVNWTEGDQADADAVLSLPPTLYEKLYVIIVGKVPSDPFPDGVEPDTYVREQVEKNSEAGSSST